MPTYRRKQFNLWAMLACAALAAALAWHALAAPSLSRPPDTTTSLLAMGLCFGLGMLASNFKNWLNQSDERSDDSKFEALVEQSLAGIYIVKGEYFRYVNPEFARMMGYDDPQQIIDQVPLADMVMPKDQDGVAQELGKRFAARDQDVRYAFTGRRRDGSPVELEVHGRAVRTKAGTVVIGLALDMSEQRRTESTLRYNEQLLRAVVEGSTDAIFVKDTEGHYLMANQACAKTMGVPLESILGKTEHELFPGETAAMIRANDERVMQSATTITVEEQVRLPSGKGITSLVTKGPMLDEQGRINGVFGISRDITALMATQASLREKQRLLDRMSALAKIGGWSVDLITKKSTRTEGAANILDLPPDKTLELQYLDGLRFFKGVHREAIDRTIQNAIATGQPYSLELELISHKGVRKWIRSQGEPIFENGQVVRLEGALQDISEVHQARVALQSHQAHLEDTVRQRTAELEAARHEAERLMRIKGEFLANMSHEIRTPLNGVLGLAQIGQRNHAGEDRQTFTQILESGRLLLGIINDILDFSKIEAGKLHIEILPVVLSELLSRAAALVRDQAEAKGIELHIHLGDELPASCDSDPLRLEQILLNLLSNAVKFTEAGRVTLSATRRRQQLVLTVADTGIGMSPPHLAELFRPFEQADGSTTRQYGGTGLGLTITKRLVELLGGQIQATSTPGQGTCFEVALPLVVSGAPGSQAAPDAAPTSTATPVRRLAGLHVLAAEDNLVNQMVLRELLSLEGASVVMVDSGVAAVEQVSQGGATAFNVVLMDIQMPLMDGYEATRRIKAIAPALPVIGQTAHAMAEERSKCLDAGMVDMVVKPINLDDLAHTVRRHVPAKV